MRGRGRAATLVVLLVTALGFAAAVPHFRFTTAITAFLPDESGDKKAQLAALLAESELSRTMTIDLTLGLPAADPDRLRELTRALADVLRAQPDVASVRSGLGEDDAAAMLAFVGELPPTTFLPASAYEEAAVRARLGELEERLGGPLGMLVRETAPRDPLGGTWEALERLREGQGGALADDDGVVMTADRTHAFLFVETRSSPFDSTAQRAFRALLAGWKARAAPPPARMETAGTAQYAIASEAQIKGDINRIGIISTIGILAIFLLLFGSVRLIGLGLVPMVFGSAVAMLACQAIFGEIHGITIAFGTSLLGVGLDYVEHYYAHVVLMPDVPATATMRKVAPSIALGAATTITGFIGLAASGLGGLRQMAAFSVIAILASLAATIWIVPRWMPARYRPPRSLAVLDRGVLAFLRVLTRRRWSRGARVAAVVVPVALTAALAGTARFSDGVNMLVDDRGPHVVEDRAVRARLGPAWDAFAVIAADDEDTLLAQVGAATAELERARAAGAVTSFVPLGELVPGPAEQRARLDAARAAAPMIGRVMEELGFVPDQFAPFWDALASPDPPLLTLAAVRRSPLAPLVSAWLPDGREPIALIPLAGVHDPAALRAAVPSATIVVPAETMVELFRAVRLRTLLSFLVGFAVIFLILLARYRDVRQSVVALAPALLACVVTVGVLVAAGVALTILHVMSLLLVISLGVDFGIFFVDTSATLEDAARTMVSILTASVTTILSFGLLGLSASPGLAAIGVTVTLGVTFSLAACLVMVALTGPTLVQQPLEPEGVP